MPVSSQHVQEAWYDFPYHYVGSLSPFSIARVYDWHLNYISTVSFLLEQIQNDFPCPKIVDIGCGDGRFSREIARAFPEATITGVDYSARATTLARAMNYNSPINFVTRDISSDPMDSDFDVAVLMEVYEHIPPESALHFLDGVQRMLRPNGVLHLTVPHINTPVAKHHFRHFDSDTLSGELSQFFHITTIKPFEKIRAARRWINRLLYNRYFILNHQGVLNFAYRYYVKHLFEAPSEELCQRLYVRAVRL